MRRKLAAALAAGIAVAALASEGRAAPAELTAAQIVEKNVAARGGLEAWRKIQTMVWMGHVESVHAPMPSMLFQIEQKRPNKTRFEVNALGEKTLRVFDGTRGWKLKPNRDGGPDLRPYTFEEVTFAHATQVIDGPLIDYEAKGNTVTLEGLDDLDGRKAYHLSIRLPTGETDQIWVDARTFLEIRYDRPTSNTPKHGTVSAFYRDYRAVEGLQIPFVIETGAGQGVKPDRMVIDKVMLNAPVDDRAFARPGGREPRGMAMDKPPPRHRLPLVPSGVPQTYPFGAQTPSGPASAPSSGPTSATAPGPASAPASGPATATAPGPGSAPASGPASQPN